MQKALDFVALIDVLEVNGDGGAATGESVAIQLAIVAFLPPARARGIQPLASP